MENQLNQPSQRERNAGKLIATVLNFMYFIDHP